jgi:hypothetical protein
VQGPRFGMQQTLQHRLSKGYNSLALIERQFFLGQFQDISFKLYLMEAIIKPTILYGSKILGPSLLQTDWARLEGVQTLLLKQIIHCKWMVPQTIIHAKFGVHPFRLEVIFRSVSFLHRFRSFKDSTIGKEPYPYLALCSSEALVSDPPSGNASGWFSDVSRLLHSMIIFLESLPSFSFSLDASRHLLSTRSFFLSALDARNIPYSYIPPGIIHPNPPIVPEDSNREPVPSSPLSPSAIRSWRP